MPPPRLSIYNVVVPKVVIPGSHLGADDDAEVGTLSITNLNPQIGTQVMRPVIRRAPTDSREIAGHFEFSDAGDLGLMACAHIQVAARRCSYLASSSRSVFCHLDPASTEVAPPTDNN